MKEKTPPIRPTDAKRRSTRVVHSVPLLITWSGPRDESIVEETATLSINCHGCQYFSRNRPKKDAQISIQIFEYKQDTSSPGEAFQARVTWVRKSRRLDGFYQVGVEFEAPQNIWPLAQPPEDWESFAPALQQEPAALLEDVERQLQFARTGDHYRLLDVHPNTDRAEIKHRFYRMARRFHPDHHMDHPEWMPRLLILMEALNAAYRVLSDDAAKEQYDSTRSAATDRELSEPKRMARDYLQNARECLAAKNYVGSILWLRRAIENEPNSSTYRAMLGYSLAHVPEYRREAVEQFEKAFELDPSNLTAHLQYAKLLESLNLPWRARAHYIRVLELDMNHLEARERLNRLDSAAPRPVSRPSLLSRITGRR